MADYERTYDTADVATGETIAADHLNAEFATIFTAIGSGGIGATQIAIAGVGNDKLAADAVDGTKIADESIDSEHYVDGSIDTAHLADDAVTAAKIASAMQVAASPTAEQVTCTTADTWYSLTLNDVTGKSLVILKVLVSGVFQWVSVRPKGETAYDGGTLGSDGIGGANLGRADADEATILITTTDSSGNIDVASGVGGRTATVSVIGFIPF